MSISISGASDWVSQINQFSSTHQGCSATAATDSATGSTAGGPTDFITALIQALESVGVGSGTDSSSAATDGTSSQSQTDPLKALAAFMHDLMAALHAEQAQNSGHHHDIQAGVQNLIQKLSTSSADPSSATSSDSALTTLESSFADLKSALGGNSSTATLQDFLQAFAANIENATSVGNAIRTAV